MPSSKSIYDLPPGAPNPLGKEEHIEYGFIGKLQNLKYEFRDDIRDRAAMEKNFREKFEALNRVKLASGSTIKTSGLPFFKELRITVPSVPEQQRIADCLSSLDALISAETQKLEALKTHKKGLMQQLFPSPGGVAA